MPLRLNLYHEVQKQAALKRRDPLKLSLFGMGAIAVCFAGYYFLQLGKSHGLNAELDTLKAQHAKLEPESKVAKTREDELSSKIKINELIERRIEDRFHWAPLLAQLIEIVPREVQLTKVNGDVSTDASKKCTLSIDGISAGTDPRKIAEELRIAVTEKLGAKYRNVTASFRTLDDGTDPVALEGKQLPTASFGINVAFNWGGDAVASTSPARRKR
jgi:Tfp pilus assembly protein PilN